MRHMDNRHLGASWQWPAGNHSCTTRSWSRCCRHAVCSICSTISWCTTGCHPATASQHPVHWFNGALGSQAAGHGLGFRGLSLCTLPRYLPSLATKESCTYADCLFVCTLPVPQVPCLGKAYHV